MDEDDEGFLMPSAELASLGLAEPGLFELGAVHITHAARSALHRNGLPPAALLAMHRCGNWGAAGYQRGLQSTRGLTTGEELVSEWLVGKDVVVIASAASHPATAVRPRSMIKLKVGADDGA